MTIPTTTSGHVTRRQVLDALADLNPKQLPAPPIADCGDCLWNMVDEADIGERTFAAYGLAEDIAAFGMPDWEPWRGTGIHMAVVDPDTKREVVLEPVLNDADPLLKPLFLQWDGDPTEIEAVLRKHGLPYVAPDNTDVCFQIVPAP